MIIVAYSKISIPDFGGAEAGRGRYLLENVLPWHHTEESTLRDLDSQVQGMNEKIILNPVPNHESNGGLPIILLQEQTELNAKCSLLGQRLPLKTEIASL